MSETFCGFETDVSGPKGGTRRLRVEVAHDVVTFRLDGAAIFGDVWHGKLGRLFAQLAADAEVVCNGGITDNEAEGGRP